MEYEFKKVVAREYSDPNRVAYVYYGSQSDGMFFQWPAIQWCPNDGFEPRYRPWYVATGTGPKDVVIILDRSGSMNTETNTPGETRWIAAKSAVEKLLLTFNDYDYVAIVAFSGSEPDVSRNDDYDPYLQKMNKDGKDIITDDFIASLLPGGGTRFDYAFDAAFEVLDESREASPAASSTCSPMFLFMTDGLDESVIDILDHISDLQPATRIPIYTYLFGVDPTKNDGKDDFKKQLPKKIACQNGGVAYTILGDSNLADIMADYYKYWANGIEYTDDFKGKMRWINYEDATLGADLLAGCAPIYDPLKLADGEIDFMGVVCIDLNLIISLDDLKDRGQEWFTFKNNIDDETSECMIINYNEKQLQDLRGPNRCMECDLGKDICDIMEDEESGATGYFVVLTALIYSVM